MIETQSVPRVPLRSQRRLGPNWLRALYAEWRRLSPGLASELPERELRIQWTNEKLHTQRLNQRKPPITSWSELLPGEAKYLIKLMREESGAGADWRGMLIARLAAEFWGPGWDEALPERLHTRFLVRDVTKLTPFEAHSEIEELLSRIAQRDLVDIETVRARFTAKAQRRKA